MALLEIQGVVSGYGESIVLNGVDLSVSNGEMVSVIGPNGAGKSTLLKSILGLVPIRSGSVFFAGQDVTRLSPEQTVALGIGYVPQVENVFPSLTVRENLELAFPRGSDRARRNGRIEKIVEEFPILGLRMGSPARALSGGERQMLAMARALVNDPALVLLDEPTAALAPVVVTEILKRISGMREGGTPVLLVEQNARAALALSDRGYVLDQGRNALDGPARTLLASPDVARLYLGGSSKETSQ